MSWSGGDNLWGDDSCVYSGHGVMILIVVCCGHRVMCDCVVVMWLR